MMSVEQVTAKRVDDGASYRPRLLHTYSSRPRPGSVALCGFVKRTPSGDVHRNGHDGRCIVCADLDWRNV